MNADLGSVDSIEIKLPNFDVNDKNAVIKEVLVNDFDYVEINQHLFTAENTKAVNRICASGSGYIILLCHESETYTRGTVLARIFENIDCAKIFKKNYAEKTVLKSKEDDVGPNATKKAVQLAEKLGLDINKICSQNGGSVVRTSDVRNYYDKNAFGSKTRTSDPVFKYDCERIVVIGAGGINGL